MKNAAPYVSFLRKEEYLLNKLSGGPVRPATPTDNNPPTKMLEGVRLPSGVIRVR
jgi:hypothetical protein